MFQQHNSVCVVRLTIAKLFYGFMVYRVYQLSHMIPAMRLQSSRATKSVESNTRINEEEKARLDLRPRVRIAIPITPAVHRVV